MFKFVKKMNDALVKQAVSLDVNVGEMRCEIWGMSNWIVDSVLEKTVCEDLHYIGTDICWEKPSQQKKLSRNSENSRRKDYEQVIRVKKDLKDLNTTDLDFPEGTRLFINDTLCPYYRLLWNKHKELSINKKKIFLNQKYGQRSFKWLFFKKIGSMLLPIHYQFSFFSNIRIGFTV